MNSRISFFNGFLSLKTLSPRRASAVWLASLAAGCLLAGVAPQVTAAPVTTSRLLDEMTDLADMAQFPNPAYTCKQFSSYDRNAKSPAQDWFANGDAGHYLRTEEHNGRKEFVMMDTEGPGAIVRIWSANPAGTLRIYIDGNSTPALESPMSDILGGKYPGLPRPIAGEYSKGWNLYFPIPYAKHCKVTSDQGKFYYHVNYRTYAGGTTVESFSSSQIKELGAKLERLAAQLAEPGRNSAVLGGDTQEFQLEIAPGDSIRQELAGPAAITRAVLRVSADDRDAALRGIVVKMTFDGEHCVEAPLGDLLGSGPGINPFSTLPVGMAEDGEMYSHWFMPFNDAAVIELVNHSQQTATLTGELVLKDYRWTDNSMHFHAKWRAEFDVPTRPMQDWNYLAAKGKGVFAGASFTIDNPVKDWWGEGDEKIYVDGEAFPSHFGTGTEDYYGYAWCWPTVFTHAYHAQPRCDGPGNYGRTSVNRFHILDRIPFTKDFKFDMELWHWNANCKVNMGIVSYWYARPGATDTFKPIRPGETVIRPMPEYVVPRVQGAIEGESLKVVRVAGTAEPQSWDSTSAGSHLWWHAGMRPGDTLTVAFPAPKEGKYRVYARFLKARDYGIHQLSVNGAKAGRPIDFYNPDVQPSNEIELGTFDLRAKDNLLSSTIVGANEKAEKSYMLGLDYLLLKPAE